MLVPFGTHVRDKDGKSIGTVSRLVLHPESRQVVALVVRQGVLDRREIVVPIRMVERAGDEVRLTLRAAELDGLDLFGTPALRPMSDQWPMPMGFDLRSFYNAGRRVGEVSGVELEPASGRITRVLVREGVLFRRETPIPAGLIASVGDRITLSVSADEVKKLERPYVDEPGTVPAR